MILLFGLHAVNFDPSHKKQVSFDTNTKRWMLYGERNKKGAQGRQHAQEQETRTLAPSLPPRKRFAEAQGATRNSDQQQRQTGRGRPRKGSTRTSQDDEEGKKKKRPHEEPRTRTRVPLTTTTHSNKRYEMGRAKRKEARDRGNIGKSKQCPTRATTR